jgi:hypothetical protein
MSWRSLLYLKRESGIDRTQIQQKAADRSPEFLNFFAACTEE